MELIPIGLNIFNSALSKHITHLSIVFICETNLQMPYRYCSGLVNKLAPFVGCSLQILSINEGLDPLFDHGWLSLEH